MGHEIEPAPVVGLRFGLVESCRAFGKPQERLRRLAMAKRMQWDRASFI